MAGLVVVWAHWPVGLLPHAPVHGEAAMPLGARRAPVCGPQALGAQRAGVFHTGGSAIARCISNLERTQ